jgi:hypothetical protein
LALVHLSIVMQESCSCSVWVCFQELGTDVNLYALVFGESVLNDAVTTLQLMGSSGFFFSIVMDVNVQRFFSSFYFAVQI